MPLKILATVTSKGQITLPVELRNAWDLRPGDQVAFDAPGLKPTTVEPRRRRSIFDRLDEMKLPSLGRPPTQQDIDDAVTEAMNEQEERSRGG